MRVSAAFLLFLGSVALGTWASAREGDVVLRGLLPFESQRSIRTWRDTCVGSVPEPPEGLAPSEMLPQYLIDQVDAAGARWEETYEALDTVEDIRAYQQRLRAYFLEAIGGEPEHTALHARVTGRLGRPGYRVEKVLFESLPRHYVSGILFLPDSSDYEPPYPGVLVPCGHHIEAKAHHEYQAVGALLALNGMAAFVFDPIDQGERIQLPGSGLNNVAGHDALGQGSILLGRNTSYFYRWDAVRALDYLESRPEVDPARLGCTGNSGGATQTLFLSSSDDRVVAAAPSCGLSRMVSKLRRHPGDVEQHVHGQMAFGLDEIDYVMMRAPEARWFICTATRDFVDIHSAWLSVRYANRLFTRLGFPERIDVLEEDVPHSYGRVQREAVARWMARWLLEEDRIINEPALDLFTVEDLQVTPEGHTVLLDGARTAYDINLEYERELAEHRRELWAQTETDALLRQVRKLAGIRALEKLSPLQVESAGTGRQFNTPVERLILKPEQGIYLPALLYLPESESRTQRVLYVDERGKSAGAEPGGPIETLVRSGFVVLALDVRGTGETAVTDERQKNYNYYRAHSLARSIMGMQAEDMLWAARFLSEPNDYFAWCESPVVLAARGNVGVPALHAAALEQQLFSAVELRNSLFSWANVVETHPPEYLWYTLAHGVLKVYDLPDLAGLIGDRVRVLQPMGANGRPLDDPGIDTDVTLLHEWTFEKEENGQVPDRVGGADATLHGAAVLRDGALDLSSNPDSPDASAPGAAWAELPIGDSLLRLDRTATFEAWITPMEEHGAAKLWSFGSSSNDEVYLWPEYGNGYSHVVAGVRVDPTAPWRNAFTISPLQPNRTHHLAITIYVDEWTRELKLYVDGDCLSLLRDPALPSQVSEYANCFLGRSCDVTNGATPLWNGLVHEFRVYDGALPYNCVLANYRAGVSDNQ